MEFEVRYFAAVRERLGTQRETFSVEGRDALPLDEVWSLLESRHPELKRIRRHIRLSVNLDFADDDVEIRDGDELGLIPPVAGGSDAPSVSLLSSEALESASVVDRVRRDSAGAIVTFEGVVRDHARGRDVVSLEYEVYPEMASEKLQQVIDEVEARWTDARCALQHRHGKLAVGDVAVVIAVSSPHRATAFEACSHAIDRIKEIVPIWKREFGPDGASWVGMGS